MSFIFHGFFYTFKFDDILGSWVFLVHMFSNDLTFSDVQNFYLVEEIRLFFWGCRLTWVWFWQEHNAVEGFDFHHYLIGCLEADFSHIVGTK